MICRRLWFIVLGLQQPVSQGVNPKDKKWSNIKTCNDSNTWTNKHSTSHQSRKRTNTLFVATYVLVFHVHLTSCYIVVNQTTKHEPNNHTTKWIFRETNKPSTLFLLQPTGDRGSLIIGGAPPLSQRLWLSVAHLVCLCDAYPAKLWQHIMSWVYFAHALVHM